MSHLGAGLRFLMGIITVALLLLHQTPVRADTGIFIYHRFGEERFPSTNIDPAIFAAQLDYLHQQGYQVLSLAEIAARQSSKRPLPEKTLGLSVDDAFSSFAEKAWPLLKAHGFAVTLFVNTDSVGSPGYLSWKQLNDLHRQGVDIGHHTASHAYLLEMEAGENYSQWQQRVKNDIQRANQAFQKNLGMVPDLFAYPYGEYHPVLADLLASQGFTAAFAQQSGVVSPWSDPFALPRFPMGGVYANLSGFKEKLRMHALPVLPVEIADPIIRNENPPVLALRLQENPTKFLRFACFVQGKNSCEVTFDPEQPEVMRVKAQTALSGRRNKYTVTTQDHEGRWYWFSQLWVQPQRPLEVKNQP